VGKLATEAASKNAKDTNFQKTPNTAKKKQNYKAKRKTYLDETWLKKKGNILVRGGVQQRTQHKRRGGDEEGKFVDQKLSELKKKPKKKKRIGGKKINNKRRAEGLGG